MKNAAKRVLVVDDDPFVGRLAVRILEGMGLEASATTHPKEALDLVRESRADLVLADAQMPDLDGVGLCRLLRGCPETRTLPVILCSGLMTEELHLAGAAGYLEKPFTREGFIRSVSSILGANPGDCDPSEAQCVTDEQVEG